MKSSTPLFSGSLEVYEWISRFLNMERGQSVRGFRLDRMKILAELTGNPETCAPAIHTAGSKGKGSVTGMAAAVLNASGRSCSVYASPHVVDFRERISLGNSFFNEGIYAAAGDIMRNAVDSLKALPDSTSALFNSQNENGEEPTFFELMTLWFFLCSLAQKVNAMAVETGMGGRLDATNILDPRCSVITLIELEHTDYLGSTLAEIAGEKAGIIKQNRPVVVAKQKDEALTVFQKKAEKTGSPFFYFPEWGEIGGLKIGRKGTNFSLKLKNKNGPSLCLKDLNLCMHGEIQAENAGLAALAARTAFPDIREEAIRNGLARFSLPARFQQLPIEQEFIIDGAHTPRSAENTIETFVRLYGKNGILVFGCVAGKELKTMASLFIPWFSQIIITTPGTFKKSSPGEIYEAFCVEAAKRESPPEILFVPDTGKALARALEISRALQLPVLGTGSFYLAAELQKGIG